MKMKSWKWDKEFTFLVIIFLAHMLADGHSYNIEEDVKPYSLAFGIKRERSLHLPGNFSPMGWWDFQLDIPLCIKKNPHKVTFWGVEGSLQGDHGLYVCDALAPFPKQSQIWGVCWMEVCLEGSSQCEAIWFILISFSTFSFSSVFPLN